MGGFSQTTLKQAAKKTGLSPRAIAYMVSEDGCNPRLSTLSAFADGYRVTIADLFATKQHVREPTNDDYSTNSAVIQLPKSQADRTLDALVALAKDMSEQGQWQLLGEARVLAKLYPATTANDVR
jgi:hypothetical protein